MSAAYRAPYVRPEGLPMLIERRRLLPKDGGGTLYFMCRSGRRRTQHRFFKPHEVPEFDGEAAVFEVAWKSWQGPWRFIRLISVDGVAVTEEREASPRHS